MAGSTASPELLSTLHNKATQLRINSVRATSEAGSGHPSSCASAADIVAALFFSVMDPELKSRTGLDLDETEDAAASNRQVAQCAFARDHIRRAK